MAPHFKSHATWETLYVCAGSQDLYVQLQFAPLASHLPSPAAAVSDPSHDDLISSLDLLKNILMFTYIVGFAGNNKGKFDRHSPGQRGRKFDRHVSGTGRRDNNKKGGHGKGNWGKDIDTLDCPAWIDKGDPNYVADEH
jgi:hypothetical protein